MPKARMLCLLLGTVSLWVALFSDARTQTPGSARSLTIEAIEFEGNSKTKKEVISQYLSIKPGDVIDLAVLDSDRRRLEQTNFFKEVDFSARPGSEKGKVIVVIEIKERRWPYYQFEGGHSDLDGWFFVPASLRFDNFFGKGNLIGLRLIFGDQIAKFAFGFRNTSLFDNKAFIDLELYSATREFIHFIGSEEARQNVEFGGLRLRLGGHQGFFKHLNFAYRVETFRPDDFIQFTQFDSTTHTLPDDLADDIAKTKTAAFSLILAADLRDNPVYPLNGFWGALSFELAHDQVGSDRNFSKITFDSRLYKQLFGQQVLALHFKGGFVGENSPFYERFYLGGANSLRGYPSRRLTPVGWGTKLILSNAELRFPLSTKNFPYHKFSGVVFFDAGGIWQPGQTPKFEDLFASAGFGFRYKLPVLGVTRFDFSFPLNKVDENDFQFHISLGHTF
ncbi:MAG: outer membrane protein assembly factor [bacterium]